MQENAMTGSTPTTTLFRNETDPKHFKAGETIFSEGSPGDYMYAVIDGEVDIVKGGKVVDTIGSGGLFGEMALIDHMVRSAAARAKTDCSAAQIDEKRFLFLVREHPNFALHLMRVLTDRIRNRTEA
jgi:CRP/FNR family cyclic AMP-dependent transcriptional regulator